MARRAIPRLWGAILGGVGSEQRRRAWGEWKVGRGARGQWCNGLYVPSPWVLCTTALRIVPPKGDAGGVAGGGGGAVWERERAAKDG